MNVPSSARPASSAAPVAGPVASLVAGLFLLALPLAPAHAGDDGITAPSGSGFYLAGRGGPVLGYMRNLKSDSGNSLNKTNAYNMIGGFGMAAGYAWAKEGLPIRTELEFMNRTEINYDKSPLFSGSSPNDAVGSTVQNVTALAKVYYHFNVGDPKWSPFLSGGFGLSRTKVKGQYSPASGSPYNLSKVTYGLAWTAGAGVSFFLAKHLVNDIELSYVDLGKVDYGLPSSVNLHSNSLGALQLTFDLRFNF